MKTLYYLAAFKYFSGAMKVGLMAFLGATAATEWYDLPRFAKFTVIASAIVQMLSFTEAFVDNTAAKIAVGKPPIGTNGTGNTEQITKQTTEKAH